MNPGARKSSRDPSLEEAVGLSQGLAVGSSLGDVVGESEISSVGVKLGKVVGESEGSMVGEYAVGELEDSVVVDLGIIFRHTFRTFFNFSVHKINFPFSDHLIFY